MAQFNIRGLDKEIARKGYRTFKPIVEQKIGHLLAQENRILLQEFESSPITQEIEAGPRASNSSGTLGGVGNLFSFLGFEAGSDPISPIRSLLINSIRIVAIKGRYKELGVRLIFTTPSIEEIEAATGLPWAAGASWVTAIEQGISNLGQYLYKQKAGEASSSRSGSAIQTDIAVRGVSSSAPAPYITQLLNDMQARIERAFTTLS